MFNTIGTVVGLATKLGIIQKDGSFSRVGRVLICDSVSTMLGAIFGTSTVTTYVESAAGISEGGRTGLTAITPGLFFLLSIFFLSLATVIPKQATAPALIIVGFLMLEPHIKNKLRRYNRKFTCLSYTSNYAFYIQYCKQSYFRNHMLCSSKTYLKKNKRSQPCNNCVKSNFYFIPFNRENIIQITENHIFSKVS